MPRDTSPLFQPMRFGAIIAPNRIVMAPLTRTRANAEVAVHALQTEYYAQRATAGLGLVLIAGINAASFSLRGLVGDAMFLVAGTFWSGFGILLRKHRFDPVLATAVIAFSALVTFVQVYLWRTGGAGLLALGRNPCGDDVHGAAAQSRRNDTAARRRRTGFEQAGPHLRDADGGFEAVPHRRATARHCRTHHSQCRRGGNCRGGRIGGRGGMKEGGDNLLHPAQRLFQATRCTAKAKRTGTTCKAPAVTGWSVCLMHGAKGGARSGPGNGMWQHGGRSAETVWMCRIGAEPARVTRNVCDELPGGRKV